jgi:hypothetical protein
LDETKIRRKIGTGHAGLAFFSLHIVHLWYK